VKEDFGEEVQDLNLNLQLEPLRSFCKMALAFLFEAEAETEALIRECNKIGCCKNNCYILGYLKVASINECFN
jgi:hypothetical protein